MYFHTLADFIAMGKHGPYVWSAYSITLAALIIIHLYNKYRHRKLNRLLEQMKRDEA